MNIFLFIPGSVLYLDDINLTSKNILALIISLSRKEGFCFASNEFLAKSLGISERSVAYSINELKKKGYITSERKRYIRYIKLNNNILIENELQLKTINANLAEINADFANTNANLADTNANSAQYNNNYNNKYKNNYNTYRHTSYDLEELMKIK